MVVSLCANYQSQKVEAKENKKNEKVTVVKELSDERTVNSNTYLLSDGSKKKEMFLSNIRYEKDGKLIDFENDTYYRRKKHW